MEDTELKEYGVLSEDGEVLVDGKEVVLLEEAALGTIIDDMVVIGAVDEGVLLSTKDNKVYLYEEKLNEAKLAPDSKPLEGFVYWDKDTAVYVVSIRNGKVSYWTDESVRKLISVEDFEKKFKPSKDVDDYEIFEEKVNEDEGSFFFNRTLVEKVLNRLLPESLELKFQGHKKGDEVDYFYSIESDGKEVGFINVNWSDSEYAELNIYSDKSKKKVLYTGSADSAKALAKVLNSDKTKITKAVDLIAV